MPPSESEVAVASRIARALNVADLDNDDIFEIVNVLRSDSITRDEHEDAIALERYLHECQLARIKRERERVEVIHQRVAIEVIEKEMRRATKAERERDELAAFLLRKEGKR